MALLLNVLYSFERTRIDLKFYFAAPGVVPCRGRKTSPRMSSIVEIKILYLSFEIRGYMLETRKKY